MAIVDPQSNLAPSYDLVQKALQSRASLERDGGARSGFAVANAVATPVANEFDQQRKYAEKTGLETFKNHLETQLYDYQKNRKAVSRDDIAKYFDEEGIDKKYLPKIQGTVSVSPEEISKMMEEAKTKSEAAKSDAAMDSVIGRLNLSANPEDHQKADALRALDKEGRKEYAKQLFAPKEKTPAQIIREQQLDAKIEENRQNAKERFEKRLDPTQRRAGAMADAAKRLSGIGRLDALFNGYQDNLTPQEWEEASLAWASILGAGNQSSRAQIEALVPQTARGNVKKTMQWITNNPTGTDQQAFAKRIRSGMDREKIVNAKIVKDSQLSGVSGFSSRIEANPEDFKDNFQNYGITYEDLKKHYPKLADKIYPEGAGQQDAKKKSADDLMRKVYPQLPANHTVKRVTKKGTNTKVNVEVDEHGNYLRELP